MSCVIEKEWRCGKNICVVIMVDLGHRCGYVGIPSNHPLYGIKYNESLPNNFISKWEEVKKGNIGKRGIMDLFCLDMENPNTGILFDVHGGITYSGSGDGKYPIKSNLWWFGYDCIHAGDARDLSQVIDEVIIEIEEKFPTEGVVRTLDYCIAECESLSRQLNDLS